LPGLENRKPTICGGRSWFARRSWLLNQDLECVHEKRGVEGDLKWAAVIDEFEAAQLVSDRAYLAPLATLE